MDLAGVKGQTGEAREVGGKVDDVCRMVDEDGERVDELKERMGLFPLTGTGGTCDEPDKFESCFCVPANPAVVTLNLQSPSSFEGTLKRNY